MKTVTLKLFLFSELPDKVKEKVRDQHRVTEIDVSDFDSTEEDVLQIAQYLGFQKDTKFLWSGFGCQGNGGQIVGRWYPSDVQGTMLRAHAPVDEKLHAIAAEFEALIPPEKDGEDLPYITIKSEGRYTHEYAVDFDDDNVPEGFDIEAFKGAYQRLCRWAYKLIEEENDYRNSKECIDEAMGEGREFFSNGTEWKEQYEQAGEGT